MKLPGQGSALAGMLVIGLGTLIVPLDRAVNIAFPDITTDFSIAISDIQWVVLSYVLTYAALMLVFGKLGDMFGHRRIFLIGLALSAVAFTACALAPAFHWLLLARLLQGIGAALVLSCGPALATALFPESSRARVLGAYTMMFGIGAAVGPFLGGFMVQIWGWEAVFWFRLPISLAALITLPWLPDRQAERRTGKFDFLGGLLLAFGLGALMLALNHITGQGGYGISIGIAGIAALVFFVWREVRSEEPIIPVVAFGQWDFTVLNVFNGLVMLVGFAPYLIVPYFLVRATGFGLGAGGIILAVSAVGQVVAAPIGGWLLSWRRVSINASPIALLSSFLVALATIAMGTWTQNVNFTTMAIPMFIQGLGLGLFQLCILDVAAQRLDVRDRGVAGSLVQVSRTIGVILGATCLSLIFAELREVLGGNDTNALDAFLLAYRYTFFIAGIGLLLCLFLTLIRPRLWFG